MDIAAKARVLAEYIKSLENFVFQSQIDGNYDHMGATITDAVLQAGISYPVVRSRVKRVLTYPDAKTASGFLQLLEQEGAENLLDFRGKKPVLVVTLTQFFVARGIQTEADLAGWLQIPENVVELKTIKGIGNKTADYLGILVGLQGVAIDRHLYNFLARAGIDVSGYEEASAIIVQASELLDVDCATLDHSIWEYMAGASSGE